MTCCAICGTTRGVAYRADSLQRLCEYCFATTPVKVSRQEFDAAYWEDASSVPERTKREFYSDYLASVCNLKQYIRETTTTAY